jgi:hypothetical protein
MEEPPPLTRCPRCGVTATGRFCSQCGASLDQTGGSFGGESKSKFVDPVTGLLAFLKAAWLLIATPVAFCRAWLNGPQGMAQMTFPLSGVWRKFSEGPQNVTSPFRALAFGVALIGASGAIEATAWKMAGLQELREEAGKRQEEGIQQAARYYYGHNMKILKLAELTGFAPLDAALEETWHLIDYLAFAALIAAFMPRVALVQSSAVLHYFAFAVGVSLAIRTAAAAVASALFIPLARGSLESALAVETFVVFVFGYLPIVWFGALLPIVIFPRVIRTSRARVVSAVVGGLAAMGLINVIRTQVMLRVGIIFV